MNTSLTHRRIVDIALAACLLGHYGAALSPFEAELVEEVGRRYVEHGRDAVVTELEWPVVDAAIAAMSAAADQAVAA